MSNIKCPVCNVGYVHESVNHWCCDYEFCPSYNETDTETYDILIRTRKALDCAINTLDTVYGMSEDDGNIETYIKCKKIEINRIIKGEQ